MGVCNLTVSWYHRSPANHGETFHARPGHQWGAVARAAWQEEHTEFRTGWLAGPKPPNQNSTHVFNDWSFFTFVREPRSRLMAGIFEVCKG